MSLHVLKRKMLNKERHRAMNSSGGGYNIAVTNTGVNKSKCAGAHNKTPIIQQSYHNLYRTRIKHYVEPKTTWKKMPESESKTHIENKASKEILLAESCASEGDNKFLSSADQTARVKALRVCKDQEYELEITGGSASKSVCP
tara:strand:- start:694 stop:1122 length:429 start_codon:yes stop_codon:yes gene_type:complete